MPTESNHGLQQVAVTGASGLIGRALCEHLRAKGVTVRRLVRSEPKADGDIRWDPHRNTIDAAALEGVDAVVHMAGVGIADRKWTEVHKRDVLDSRVAGTSLLAQTLAGLDRKPSVLASASAVGFYGDRGDEIVDEQSKPGTGFLADVVRQWESATEAASNAGIRVATMRSGVVLSTTGGALKKQLLPFKLGLGGRLGSGRQYVPWITLDDEVAAIMKILEDDRLRGPVNLMAPTPVTNGEMAKAIGAAVRRPVILPTPLLPLKIAFGAEMVREMLLASCRAVPAKLSDAGFTFRHPEIREALATTISGRR